MLRDSRIVHIIDLLGELRELLLVIDQAGDTAPAILLKLAKEKGMSKVKANIYSFNKQSQTMFQSIGFVKTEEEWYEYII